MRKSNWFLSDNRELFRVSRHGNSIRTGKFIMGHLHQTYFVGDASDHIMIIRPVQIECSNSLWSKIDINASPSLLVKKQRIGTKDRMVGTDVQIDTLGHSKFFYQPAHCKILPELRKGEHHRLKL